MKTSKVFTTAHFDLFRPTTTPTNNHLYLVNGPIAVRIREVGLVHFFAMAGVVGFIVIHLTLVALVPSTLLPMFTGRAPRDSSLPEGRQ